MRFNKGSEEEGSQQIQTRKKRQESEQDESEQNFSDDDPINCPLMFKTIVVSLITIGILAFVITFAIQVQSGFELYPEDFSTCTDSSNLRRVTKFYAYEKIILGLSISGLVLAFGLAAFLIKHAYDFCRCFDDCCDISAQQSESQSQSSSQSEDNDFNKRKQKLKEPGAKEPSSTTNILGPKKRQKDEARRKVNNPHIRKYLRPLRQIKEIDKNYNENGGNSDEINCDCECNDIASCLACCSGCLWFRTCFEAHHYRFYKTKNQEYAYWIIYMTKTLFFGAAVAYSIRINVAFNELACSSDNAKAYNSALYNAMVIGIITICVDFLGYIHLLVEGSLWEVVSDTFHQKRKSQNSDDSDSDNDDESSKDNENGDNQSDKRKKNKKYKDSQNESELKKTKNKKKNIPKKSSQELHQSSESQEIPTKLNLVSSLKKDKSKHNFGQDQQNPGFSKDTDSFFIKIKTLGDKFMADIGSQNDQDEDQPRKKKQKGKTEKKGKFGSGSQSQESNESSNKKPQIFVPKNLEKLPKFDTKQTKMIREDQSLKEEPFWKSELKGKKEGFEWKNNAKESQKLDSEIKFKRSDESQEPDAKGTGKFVGLNKDKTESKARQFQKLSKFSTKF